MRASLPLLAGLLLCLFHSAALGTEEYSELTGRGCAYCHIDPSGGSELTTAGKDYFGKLTLAEEGGADAVPENAAKGFFRTLRLIAGYLHVFTGIFWFGTILYVHLILKPTYASHGLPRGEVRLGLISIATMAVTGTILTVARVPSFSFFFETRFGILLIIKIVLFLLMASAALFVVTVLGPKLKGAHPELKMKPPEAMNQEQLRSFDGVGGRAAYIAYAGKVFDVSRSPLWTGGKHYGRHVAGEDLTEAIEQAPHGETKVLEMPQAGVMIAGEEDQPAPWQARVFFGLAYLNLAFVTLIILILALWRWW